mmetsp:Transcript_18188/g.42302  ORF Transcript_18188/g.42302 Transcript_18188/m.42302 type:complete len:504 (-) Transcript_18188:35-1546(-)
MTKAPVASAVGYGRLWRVKLCLCIHIWACEGVVSEPAAAVWNGSDQEPQTARRMTRRAATALMTVDSDGRLHRERPSADAELAGLANSTPTAAFADHTARDDAGGQDREHRLSTNELLGPSSSHIHLSGSGVGEDLYHREFDEVRSVHPLTSVAVAVDDRGHVMHAGKSSQRHADFWEKVGSAEVAAPSDGELQPAPEGNLQEPPEPSYMKALEGIGASAFARSPAGSRSLDRELRDRLQIQDVSALLFLAMGLGATVLVTCFSVYKSAEDISPAMFYTEPSYSQPRMLCCSDEVADFLQSFNTQPRSASLRIVGLRQPWRPGLCGSLLQGLQWVGYTCIGTPRHEDAPGFDVVLDLAPFIAGDGSLSIADQALLEQLLHSENPLLEIVLQKKVHWKMWEDVATNIRQRLRSLGFAGSIEISLDSKEEVVVFKNDRWSNFVRNPVTHALAVLSVVGIFLWKPYVWLRTERVKVEARFDINIEPARYWELLSAGLDGAEGFRAS